jgi:hypothetical protein
METPSARLRQLLSSFRQRSAGGGFFVSYHDLTQGVTKSLVSDVVDQFYFPEHRRSAAVTTILKRGLIVFSILVWIYQEDQISHFIENDELDSRLPMEEGQVIRIAAGVSDRFWKEVQWEFLPYKFKKNDYHRLIDGRVILPFLEEFLQEEGVSGEIFKSTIPAAQQTLLPCKVRT